jgi:hypothetical protein
MIIEMPHAGQGGRSQENGIVLQHALVEPWPNTRFDNECGAVLKYRFNTDARGCRRAQTLQVAARRSVLRSR